MTLESCSLPFLLLLAICSTGCNSPKPGDVYKVALLSANVGKYNEADAILSESMKKAFSADTLHKMWDIMTSQRTISTIEVLKEITNRSSSSISLKVTYKDGAVKETKEVMIKENGEWRLSSYNLTQANPIPAERKPVQNSP